MQLRVPESIPEVRTTTNHDEVTVKNPIRLCLVDVAAIAILGGAYACSSPNPPGGSAQASLCDASDTAMMADRGLSTDVVSFAQTNGYFGWCVPEFDDDQRFRDPKTADDYGPVAHVIATPALYDLASPTQFDAKFVQVAIVEVDPESPPDMPASYQLLGLSRYNCVYLHRANTSPNGFEAAIIPPVGAPPKCPATPTASVARLSVKIDTPVSDDPDDYPPVTRFIEGEGGITLIGVRCGNRWCVIGPKDFGAIPPSAHASIAALTTTKQGQVKGWFDDQVLGIPDAHPKHNIHRRIRASAIPDPNLGNLRVQDFIATSFKVVGKVYLERQPDADSKYAAVFHFSRDTNTVIMRAEIKPGGPGVKDDTTWIARVIDHAGNVSPDIKTRRTDHRKWFTAAYGSRAKMPATMRWRWDDKDEDLWAECDMGCCRVGIK